MNATVCTMIYLIIEGSSKQRGITWHPITLPLPVCVLYGTYSQDILKGLV